MHEEVVHMKGFKNILSQNVVSYFGEKLPYAVQSVLFSPDCGLDKQWGACVALWLLVIKAKIVFHEGDKNHPNMSGP